MYEKIKKYAEYAGRGALATLGLAAAGIAAYATNESGAIDSVLELHKESGQIYEVIKTDIGKTVALTAVLASYSLGIGIREISNIVKLAKKPSKPEKSLE